jgi:predicted kinase
MKNKIILVGGYCAAGKSTFARRLSQEVNIPCFEQDTLDETICDGFGRESGVYKMGSENVAFDLMLHIVERFLRTEKSCILESAFGLEGISKIKKLLDKYNCECLLFVLKGNPDVMLERYIERDKSGERHWIHNPAQKGWFINEMPKDKLEEAEIEQKIIVDTTSFEKVDYEALYDAAKRFISNCTEV